MDPDAASITVRSGALDALATGTRSAAPDPGTLAATLGAGSQALAGLSSAAALAEVGAVWLRQLGDLQRRWHALAADLDRAGLRYDAVDTELAS